MHLLQEEIMKNAAVAVTMGLYEMLNEDELEGVIAHELSHIKHYDILIGTIAAVLLEQLLWLQIWCNLVLCFGNSETKFKPYSYDCYGNFTTTLCFNYSNEC